MRNLNPWKFGDFWQCLSHNFCFLLFHNLQPTWFNSLEIDIIFARVYSFLSNLIYAGLLSVIKLIWKSKWVTSKASQKRYNFYHGMEKAKQSYGHQRGFLEIFTVLQKKITISQIPNFNFVSLLQWMRYFQKLI